MPASCRSGSIVLPRRYFYGRAWNIDQFCSPGFQIWFLKRTHSVVNSFAVFGSHNLIKLSLDPEAIKALYGCQSTHFTSHPWPDNALSSTPVLKSQIFISESSEPVANRVSDGANLEHEPSASIQDDIWCCKTHVKSRIASLWAWNIFRLLILDCQYLIIPLWSPVTIQLSLCDHFIARTAESCACENVSTPNIDI